MALMIGEDCTACGVCMEECDVNLAIAEGDPIYVIDPAKCTECIGIADEPKCQPVCPVECIVLDPKHKESKDQLQAKYDKLHG
jgi:ferredoxin